MIAILLLFAVAVVVFKNGKRERMNKRASDRKIKYRKEAVDKKNAF